MKKLADRIRKWVGVSPIGLLTGWLIYVGFLWFHDLVVQDSDTIFDRDQLLTSYLWLLPVLVLLGTIWVRRFVLNKISSTQS